MAINIGWVGCWRMKDLIVALSLGVAVVGLGCNALLGNKDPYLVEEDASPEGQEDSDLADASSDASVAADGGQDAARADALSDVPADIVSRDRPVQDRTTTPPLDVSADVLVPADGRSEGGLVAGTPPSDARDG